MLNTIDLFAGCGGLTDGFKLTQKYNLLAAVEWDKAPLISLRNRLEKKWNYNDAESKVIHFDIQRTRELIDGFENDPEYGDSIGLSNLVGSKAVDVIIGGPPCQAYSIAGRIRDEKGMKDDYRNYLFESYIKVVEYFQPTACVFENVVGMLSATPDGTPIIERIKSAFEKVGYVISENIKEQAVFDVSDFGIPQKRQRVILIAFNKNIVINPKEKINEFYHNLEKHKENKKTVDDAISDLPPIFPCFSENKKISHKSSNERFPITDHLPRFHNSRDIEIFKMLTSDIESGCNEFTSTKALQKIYEKATGKSSNVHKYHVLRRNQPSNTIPAHLYKDGLRHIHPDPKQARSITVREAARLQTFADDFEFLGSMGAKYKMIGNAVPPEFARKIALALDETLKGI